jgi:hypothetical protein
MALLSWLESRTQRGGEVEGHSVSREEETLHVSIVPAGSSKGLIAHASIMANRNSTAR